MPINTRNARNKEINRMKNTIKGVNEQGKQYRNRRDTANGVFTGGAYQLNRISSNKCSATMGGNGNCVAP